MTMTLVSTTTLSGAATNITFSSIPQTGTDLFLVLSSRRTSGGNVLTSELSFNNDVSISSRRISGSGSIVSNSNGDAPYLTFSQGTSTNGSTFASYMIYIPNYTVSGTKSFSIDVVTENMATAAYQYLIAGSWNGTAAITSVKFDAGDTFATGTSASLYIVTKGSGGATAS